ncbi:MAG: hypothetical protein LBN32_00260 [Helicobacteraceae bacterium]|jgi:hypothetical protein|nr:hypothetical protein [Helicobacteraceae bacterium]
MQRISADTRTLIADFLWLIPLIIYESLGTVYYFLPPLFGFFAAVLALNKRSRHLLVVLIYLLFFEADHGFFIASSWLFLLLFFRFFVPLMEDNIISKTLIVIFSVAGCYIGYFIFVSLIYFIFGMPAIEWNFLVLYYIAIETILAVVILCA